MSAGIKVTEYWTYEAVIVVAAAATVGFAIPSSVLSANCRCFSLLWIGAIICGVVDAAVIAKVVYDSGCCGRD